MSAGHHVEQKDDRDGLGHLLVFGAVNRGRGGDGRPAAMDEPTAMSVADGGTTDSTR